MMRIARQVCPDLGWNRTWLGLLRRRGDRLSSEQRYRLRQLFTLKPALEPIYAMKETLCRFLSYKRLDRGTCKERLPHFLRVIQTLKDSGFEAAATLAKTLSEWIEEIVRMWRFTRNNGITEGFHRKMKLIQRRAYGFRSFTNYRLRVIAQCG